MSRWKLAQEYERNWWLKRAETIYLDFYKNFAIEIISLLKPFIEIGKKTKILEIGSGAAGLVTHLQSDFCFAIDPLEDFYASIPRYKNYRDNKVFYQAAIGENLPFKSEVFDLIIMDNVLDHCENPQQVLNEMKRVIKKGGILYFRQNTYHLWGRFIRKLMELFLIDKGHPHTFYKKQLKRYFSNHGFEILYNARDGYFSTWLYELKSKRLVDKIKALLLVNRDKFTLILKKL